LLTRAKLNINVNLGIASNNEFSADAVSMLQNIELALVTARKGGLNKFVIYSEELAETQTEEYKHYQEIKTAIAEHQFTLFYQPIYDVNKNKPIAYESLVRWMHPTLGILTPFKFLPIMEQTGDINWIGSWAFEQLLRTQTKHYKEHPEDSELIFSLNLSPKQLMYPHLAEEFRKIYKRFKIPAKNICMEIVEFSMFDKVPEVSSNILKLTQMGFRIAVDDFGLEMSSLKTLEGLQFDWVKLDRKFIEQAQDDFL
ncbi:MAG: EAL domain-containing protein, partial [Clostridia bacterium]|nr:EAL domain-containing protein [Clostridia bacterium]